MLAKKTEAVEERALAGTRIDRDPLSAVSLALQLKCQNFGCTVTNWDRIR